MKARVDLDACEGHGRCYALAPDVFAPDASGHCVVQADDIAPASRAQARAAAANCPEEAISLVTKP